MSGGPFLPVAAISRSQSIRIGDAQKGSIGSHTVGQVNNVVNSVAPFPYYVDLSDPTSRRDLAHHSAIGAVIVVGNITKLSSDFGVTSGLAVTSGTGLTVNISSGVLTQFSSDGAATISVTGKTGLATPAPAATATDVTYLVVVTDLAGADQGTIEAVAGVAAGTGASVAPPLVANTVPLATVVVSNGASSVGTIVSVAPAVATNSFVSVSTTSNATVGGNLAVAGTFGVNGATPVGASTAYTKTYNTATRTIPAATYVTTTLTSTQNATTTASDPATTQALANALKTSYNAAQVDIAALKASMDQLAADNLALKKLIVALVVDLEAVGIAG